MKKTMALLATAGMLTAPVAMAQDSEMPASATQAPQTQNSEQDLPNSGGYSGFANAMGVSTTVLTAGIGTALAVAIAVAADSSSSSGSTGTR